MDGNYNLGKNICGIFYFLTKFSFTTNKTEIDYYHQRVNIPIASQVAERLKTLDCKKAGNFKKTLEILGIKGKDPTSHPKPIFDICAREL